MARYQDEDVVDTSELLSANETSTTAETSNPAIGSRFAQRISRRYADSLHLLDAGEPVLGPIAACYQRVRQQGAEPGAALRIVRQLVLLRLIALDCEQQCALPVVTRAMTDLAEFALDIACTEVLGQLDALHGAPRNAAGERTGFWIMGMGKLGARELNVSSDIDLIYLYEEDGQTAGRASDSATGLSSHSISTHEYYAKAVRGISTMLSDVTEHGCVFRVDLALRPNGLSGPSCSALGALEDYLQSQGREWERFAWLKSRVVAPAAGVQAGGVHVRKLVLPFVFRRYLDYSVFDALRVLHRQIREHALRRAAGRPERANDVKLSRGGIREIEFTVQLLQVVRGGQFPELRTRPTLDALTRLAHAGLMPLATAQALGEAYVFLRRLEHRIQYLDDQQTHVIPTDDHDLAWIARTLGFSDTRLFLHALDSHRELVASEFDILLGAAAGGAAKSCGCGPASASTTSCDLQQWDDAALDHLPAQFRARVQAWRVHPRVVGLSDASRARLVRLVQRTTQWLADGECTEAAAVRLADWLEPLLRRENYLALLVERPAVHQRLLRLMGAARWPARYLLQHPGVIDELASNDMLDERFDAAQFSHELQLRARALHGSAEADEEALMTLLRRAHHAEVFRTLARDIEGRISVEQVADDLSLLAQTVLGIAAQWCWERFKQRHSTLPAIAIIAYGKLGGKELGYGSDLDIVFLYDGAGGDADTDANIGTSAATAQAQPSADEIGEIYNRFARKLIFWLTVKTAEGDLYEIDTALRPNGSSGLLVTTLEAYADYQSQRGSNAAWTWEHQAMTRARCVLGSPAMQARFDTVRDSVLNAPRERAKLAQEITAMRHKVHAAHPVKSGVFDVKHSPGAMVDVEFAVQFLVLLYARDHGGLRENAGNIALLQRAEAAGLLPAGMGSAAANAYRVLRQVQHRARLDEEPTQVPADQLAAEQHAVRQLWAHVLGTGVAARSDEKKRADIASATAAL